MTSIDDYVRRVRFWLPGHRGRIAAEDVKATLEGLLEERERQLGRPLYPTEIAAELQAFGSPEIIASRYSLMRPLVSAGLMPAYVRVLGIAVGGVLVVQLALAIGINSGDAGTMLATAGARIIAGLLWSFTSVTLVFAALTRIYVPSAHSDAGIEC
ncbi:hypothetical protein [Brevundimonas naejangsanensis]|uniref:hypothetical protein n=1 Tax=Brevundimonas naejangsanensis TaxID=588932 RepID=UPI0011A1FCDF|nr:hypothetical protein [Brevundimonas naejangsanensis]